MCNGDFEITLRLYDLNENDLIFIIIAVFSILFCFRNPEKPSTLFLPVVLYTSMCAAPLVQQQHDTVLHQPIHFNQPYPHPSPYNSSFFLLSSFTST